MQRRRLIAALSSAALAAGFLAGTATPVVAATASPASASIIFGMPNTTFSGSVGDTFTLTNAYSNAYIINATGSVALSGNACATNSDCVVTTGGGTGTITLQLVSSGTFEVRHTGGGLIGTLTASVTSGGSIATESETPSVTMTFDGNGGNCSSNPIEISGRGGATYNLPTEGSGSGQCQRGNYSLLGWSHEQDATSVDPNLTPGATVTFANAGGTMYAVWQAKEAFSEVTYDSNVAAVDLCWDNEGNNVVYVRYNIRYAEGMDTYYDRETTVLTSASDLPASSAPCHPPWAVLTGWNTAADGTGTSYSLTEPIGDAPSQLRLYARWGVPEVTAAYLVPVFSGSPLVTIGAGDTLPLVYNTAIPGRAGSLLLLARDSLGRSAPNVLIPVSTLAPLLVSTAEALGDVTNLSDSNFVWVKTNSSGTGVASIYTRTTDPNQASEGLVATWTAADNQFGLEFFVFGVRDAASVFDTIPR